MGRFLGNPIFRWIFSDHNETYNMNEIQLTIVSRQFQQKCLPRKSQISISLTPQVIKKGMTIITSLPY